MASFSEVDASAYSNVDLIVGCELSSISRDGKSVTFKYRAYAYSSAQYTYNSIALWVEGKKNVVFNSNSGANHSTQNKKYYTSYYTKTVSLGVSTTSTTVSIGVNNNAWNPSSSAGTVKPKLTGIPVCTAPTLVDLEKSNLKDKSVDLSFVVKGTNNGSITDYGIQLSLTNFGDVVKSADAYEATITELDPYRTYYARGFATNAAGTTYTDVLSFKTTFTTPGAPGAPILTYDKSEPIPQAKMTATWTKAAAGSTAIGGYRIFVYKNGTSIKRVDTDSTAIKYTFDSFESLGCEVGDVIKVGIYAYCYDWNNVKHFNGGGGSEDQVYSSNTITIISDKYIYVSVNGGAFTKYKMYLSQDGGTFNEVKKESFKVI